MTSPAISLYGTVSLLDEKRKEKKCARIKYQLIWEAEKQRALNLPPKTTTSTLTTIIYVL